MWGDFEPRRENARRAALVFGASVGAIAALLGAGGVALLVWSSHVDLGLHFDGTIEGGNFNLADYTGPTLPRQRGDECVQLHEVRDAAADARDVASFLAPDTREAWPARQARIGHALTVFDLRLAAAEERVPPQLAAELRQVRLHVERGRLFAASARGETAYTNAVTTDVVDGYRNLSTASAMLGSGCGANFQLAPPITGF
jgi:hypothetical protein